MNNLIHAMLLAACITQGALLAQAKADTLRAPAVYVPKDQTELTKAEAMELCLIIVAGQNSFECDPDGDIHNGDYDAAD